MRGLITGRPVGHVEADRGEHRLRSPAATPMPATSPSAEATQADDERPRASTERITWRRLAPMARSIAISLVRWATMIEKVL